MKLNYLFPNKYKKPAWLVLVPSIVIGFAATFLDLEPEFLTMKVPAIFIDEIMGQKQYFGFVTNNILEEICGVSIIISGLLVAFSKEKTEDEFIAKIRLESLVWAVYLNYGVLLFSMIIIYDLTFLWIMVFNMFTILLFFIIRFNWQIIKLKNAGGNEE